MRVREPGGGRLADDHHDLHDRSRAGHANGRDRTGRTIRIPPTTPARWRRPCTRPDRPISS
jgi:hypothetical protein